MSPKCSANSAGGDKPVKRARNVMTLKETLSVRNRLGHRKSVVSVVILASTVCHGTHRFICFVGRQHCYIQQCFCLVTEQSKQRRGGAAHWMTVASL